VLLLGLQLSQKEVMWEGETPERLPVESQALAAVPQASAEQVFRA
jgi:hypothetical protein